VLSHEGGFVDHPDDPGGATKWGVSLRFLRAHADVDQDWDLDFDGDLDADDIRLLTKGQAVEVFHDAFWREAYDVMPHELAEKVFDMAVNMGSVQAHRVFQRGLQSCGYFDAVVDDGIVGPITLRSAETAWRRHGMGVRFAVRAAQAGFYRSLILRNEWLRKHDAIKDDGSPYEDFSKFKNGWLRRAAW
jgi:lysozyme family protein